MAADIVGRSQLRAALHDFLSSAPPATGVLVLEGDPGIGKTTLWRAALGEAVQDFAVILRCAPAESERTLGYAALADLLAGLDDQAMNILPSIQRQSLEQVLLRSNLDATGIDPRAVGAALLSVLNAHAPAQLLLAVDDWQWVDPESRAALAFALRRTSCQTRLLATVRPGYPEAFAGLEHDQVRWLSVDPMAETELHQLLETRLNRSIPRPAMERIQSLADGNPWFALELAFAATDRTNSNPAGPDPLPATLGQLVATRLDRLHPDAHRLIQAAAALADPTADKLRTALALDGSQLEQQLHSAEQAGLLEMQGHRIRFTHPLFAAGVLERMSGMERRSLHRQLAEVAPDTEQRANHLAQSTLQASPQIHAALDAAAIHARQRGAPAAAARFVELALQLGGDTPPRHLALASHWLDAGDLPAARHHAQLAAQQLPAGDHRATALHLQATLSLYSDSYAQAAALIDQGLGEPGLSAQVQGRLLVEQSFVLTNLGQMPRAYALMVQAVERLEPLDCDGLLASALAGRTMTRYLRGEGLDREALRRAVDLEDPEYSLPVMLRPSLIHGLLLVWSGELAEGRQIRRALRERCIDHGEENDVVHCSFYLAIADCWAGDLAAAQLVAADSIQRARHLDSSLASGTAKAAWSVVCAYLGELETGRQVATDALADLSRGDCRAAMVWPQVALGQLELSAGNYRQAAEILGPMAVAVREIGYGEPTAAPYAADAAQALLGAGRLDEARELIDHLESEGQRLDRPWALALGGRCRALLLASEGQLDAALAALTGALEEHRRLPMPFELGRTQLVLGQIQRRRRQKKLSLQAFTQALAIFETMGARCWAEQARQELARSPVATGSAQALSASELRVAELAASGMTNRAVSQALSIHPKTVEAHLSRVYRKLGIGSRAELGRWVADSMHAEQS